MQFQFLGATFLLFPLHISSQTSQPIHKKYQRLYTGVVARFSPARAKRIDQQRNLPPVADSQICEMLIHYTNCENRTRRFLLPHYVGDGDINMDINIGMLLLISLC